MNNVKICYLMITKATNFKQCAAPYRFYFDDINQIVVKYKCNFYFIQLQVSLILTVELNYGNIQSFFGTIWGIPIS